MTSFDLPSLPGFDPERLRSMLPPGVSLDGSGVQGPEGTTPERRKPRISGVASRFEGALADSIAQVQGLQDDAKAKVRGLALGEGDVELHDVLIATGKSEVAFNLMLEVRNKLVDAWDKLSRSSV